MLKDLVKRNSLIFLIVMSMFLIPVLVEAGGGCGCKTNTYYPYNSSNLYGRSDSYFGYPGYSAYSPGYSYYPSTSRYNSILPYSSYSSIMTPYSSGNFGFNYGGYPSWGGQGLVTSKEYTTEQSRIMFVPGGALTSSFSESTEISYPGFMSYSSYDPYSMFGFGSFGGFGGW